MIFANVQTKQNFLTEIDKFGDSYSKNVSAEELKEIFEDMNPTFASLQKPDLRERIFEIESHCFERKTWWGIFRNFVLYFDRFSVVKYVFCF
jgi:hypothetical protein